MIAHKNTKDQLISISQNSMESVIVIILLENYAKLAQLGESSELDCAALKSDGVFFTCSRGQFTSHASFALLCFFGHIWHGALTLFRDTYTGIDPTDLDNQVEFISFQKLENPTTRSQVV